MSGLNAKFYARVLTIKEICELYREHCKAKQQKLRKQKLEKLCQKSSS